MGVSSAVDWWEEWQLRVLVLASLLIQWFLFFCAPRRKSAIPSSLRALIWLAYLGSDAISIYALAALFNRHRKQGYSPGHGKISLEVVWAPVLLIHLGGQDAITAFNIEDNELWRRHILTSVSQIAVAIYVFCKSWPGGDKRLLQAAILLFTVGILRCLQKPLALKRASFNSLVSSYDYTDSYSWREANRADKIDSLEEFVQKVSNFVIKRAQGEGDTVDVEANHPLQAEEKEDDGAIDSTTHFYPGSEEEQTHKLFMDIASPYFYRFAVLKSLWGRHESAYFPLNLMLSDTFDLLYTKIKTVGEVVEDFYSSSLKSAGLVLPYAAIGLFHHSHREAYDDKDVKVTYVLFCCTAVLESLSVLEVYMQCLSTMVSQFSLVGFFLRGKRHSTLMCMLSMFRCKDFVDQHWCLKSVDSCSRITDLAFQYVKGWWKEHIVDVASYRRFNDYRGQWTIQRTGCNQDLEWGLKRPFDESVLLWHVATDLCFYQMGSSSASHEKAKGCREISNYMMYLLFVNPEMLMSGARRNAFITANAELKDILEDNKQAFEQILYPGDYLSPKEAFMAGYTGVGIPSLEEIEREFMQRIFTDMQAKECKEEAVGSTQLPPDAAEKSPTAPESFFHDAWNISKALLDLVDEHKIWEVIEGVWVEMICFSASRCRGYLHAKSLGTGGELLTYIWLLLSHMGMETLPERLQRAELSGGEGNVGAAPSASHATG